MFLIPVLERQRQAGLHEFEVSLGYKVSSRPAWTTWRKPVWKNSKASKQSPPPNNNNHNHKTIITSHLALGPVSVVMFNAADHPRVIAGITSCTPEPAHLKLNCHACSDSDSLPQVWRTVSAILLTSLSACLM